MDFVNITNTDYQELYNHVLHSDYLTTFSSENHVKLLVIDTPDVNRFFSQLQDILPPSYSNLLDSAESESFNSENKARCSFGMTSSMIKGLAVSTDIYRNLTSGSY
jgi:hypothetical protein